MGRGSGPVRGKSLYWPATILAAIGLFLALYLMLHLPFLVAWALSMTFTTVGLYAVDKVAAKAGWKRATEMQLLVCAIAGGGIGAFLAMIILPHKKNKGSFWAINIFSALMWAFLLFWEYI